MLDPGKSLPRRDTGSPPGFVNGLAFPRAEWSFGPTRRVSASLVCGMGQASRGFPPCFSFPVFPFPAPHIPIVLPCANRVLKMPGGGAGRRWGLRYIMGV